MYVLMLRDAYVFPYDSQHTCSNMAGASQREPVTWLSLALSKAFKDKRDYQSDGTQHDQCWTAFWLSTWQKQARVMLTTSVLPHHKSTS